MNMSANYCPECGYSIKKNQKSCSGCGKLLVEPEPTQEKQIHNNTYQQVTNVNVITRRGPYNKFVSLLLLFFLGYFGAHKFYEGKTSVGVLYIFLFVFFWLIIPGFILGFALFIDFISLLFKPVEYYI
jgi:TM2 domain-containing membrane protein YozV